MNEEDKRVIRTRAKLTEALIALSCEQGYDAVTVQEIAERAGINYRTFYRHYESKDDLLRDVLQTTMLELRETMPPPTPEELSAPDYHQTARRNTRDIYQYVADNSDIFRLLLQSGPLALIPIHQFARQETEKFFAGHAVGDVPHDLIANHMISATFAMMRWWLENDMAYTPEQMAEYSVQLIMLPIRRLLLSGEEAVG